MRTALVIIIIGQMFLLAGINYTYNRQIDDLTEQFYRYQGNAERAIRILQSKACK